MSFFVLYRTLPTLAGWPVQSFIAFLVAAVLAGLAVSVSALKGQDLASAPILLGRVFS